MEFSQTNILRSFSGVLLASTENLVDTVVVVLEMKERKKKCKQELKKKKVAGKIRYSIQSSMITGCDIWLIKQEVKTKMRIQIVE